MPPSSRRSPQPTSRSTKIVFLASTPESAAKCSAVVSKVAPCARHHRRSGALEDHPQARLRAPHVEPPGAGQPFASRHRPSGRYRPRSVSAAAPNRRARSAAPWSSSSNRPANAASAGLDELQQQTVGLLSFKKLNKDVYDAQVSFNLLPHFG